MQPHIHHRRGSSFLLAVTLTGLLAAHGCEGPLEGYDPSQLQQQVIRAARADLDREASPAQPAPPPPAAEPYDAQRQARLDELSGPEQYLTTPPSPGLGLDGRPTDVVSLELDQVIRRAVEHNLDSRIARLVPQIRARQVVEAEANFDPAAFSQFQFHKVDQPLQASSLNGVPIGTTMQRRDNIDASVGLRKRMSLGTEISASTGLAHVNDKTPGLELTPDPGATTDVSLSVTQPLLRNFGAGVNRAQIRLARHAEARDVLALELTLNRVVADVESAYWELVLAQHQLGIRQHLLEQTLETRDGLVNRSGVDVSPLQLAQADSYVELRQADVISARRDLRDASDRLKHLLNAPDVPLIDERLVLPMDEPDEQPVDMSLRDAVTAALQDRPEIGQSLLTLRDSAIRINVAENFRLPQLDLSAEMRWYGLDGMTDQSYNELTDGDFFDYLVGLRFEQPIGNRAADAVYQRERLTRQAQVLNFHRTARDVMLSVKQAMRRLRSAEQLITVARAARRATAENLRTLEEREETGEALTPEFLLDLKLGTQQRLADAELREIQAVIEYQVARARFYEATAQLLARRRVVIEDAHSVIEDELGDAAFVAEPTGEADRGNND
jgi:outer membrane protein TolC